jgi:hypothetical protein
MVKHIGIMLMVPLTLGIPVQEQKNITDGQ